MVCDLTLRNGIEDRVKVQKEPMAHDNVIKWKHFRVTGHLCGEFTGYRWIPRIKASDAEL